VASAFELSNAVLMKEWDFTQSNIGRFDTIMYTIRAWSLTALTGGIGVAAAQHAPQLMLLVAIVAMALWFLDALHKSFQRVFILRSREIEDYLQSPRFQEDHQLERWVGLRSPDTAGRLRNPGLLSGLLQPLGYMAYRSVIMVHLPVVTMCVVAFVVLQLVIPAAVPPHA
jgi:hypothetical protein